MNATETTAPCMGIVEFFDFFNYLSKLKFLFNFQRASDTSREQKLVFQSTDLRLGMWSTRRLVTAYRMRPVSLLSQSESAT